MSTDEDPKTPAAKLPKPTESSTGAPVQTGCDTAAGPGPQPATIGEEGHNKKRPDPTRYGDWEKNGRCIDF
jgi:hypothetical protein